VNRRGISLASQSRASSGSTVARVCHLLAKEAAYVPTVGDEDRIMPVLEIGPITQRTPRDRVGRIHCGDIIQVPCRLDRRWFANSRGQSDKAA
jgi:hypothetical protein